jgi:hypothetical protein
MTAIPMPDAFGQVSLEWHHLSVLALVRGREGDVVIDTEERAFTE